LTEYLCYILQCADGTYYTGWTTDLERRVRQHNAGRAARYTRSRRPVRPVYYESLSNRAAAMKREAALKKFSRRRKLSLILGGVETRQEPSENRR